MTLKIIHAYHSEVIYIFFYKFFSKRSLWHGLIGHNYGRFNYNRLSVAVSPEEISQVPHGEDWITRETWPDGTGAGRGNGKKRAGHATIKSEKPVDAGADSTERSLWEGWTPCFVNYKNDIKTLVTKLLNLLCCFLLFLFDDKRNICIFFVLFLLIFLFGNYKLISENGLRKNVYISLNVSKVYESFKEKKAVLNKEKTPDRCLRQFDQLKIKTTVEKIKYGM